MLIYSSIAKDINDNKKERLIDSNKDIGDVEFNHFSIFGNWIDEELKPVFAVTFDSVDKVKERLSAIKSILVWAMVALQSNKQLQYGRVFCVNRSSHEITSINVRELELESWVYNKCSKEALSIYSES